MKAVKTRPGKMPPVSDQMQSWSSALANEVADWPRASARSFFGFTALYRGEDIFAMVPRTKSFGAGNLIALRIDDPALRLRKRLESDPGIGLVDPGSTRWFTFALTCDADLHEALDWLGAAYQSAAKRKKTRK